MASDRRTTVDADSGWVAAVVGARGTDWARLVLVTDGVVESRLGDLDEGLARLGERASKLRDRPLEELVEALAALADSSMRDDVTVLAIRVR